jgi:ribosomal protein S18 acetylase RimI-like enzyme
MELAIVPITEEHIDGFGNSLDTIARERRWLGAFEGFTPEFTNEFVTGMIENDHPFFVVLDGETVVGWVFVRPARLPVSAHVGDLVMGLLKDYRGQGLGTKLIQTAIEKAKNMGFLRIELEVFPHNTAGLALYEKVGFRHEGTRARAAKLDEGYVDMLMMATWLGD